MKVLLIVAAAFGAILLFLLATASANTALFAQHYPWLLGLNAVVAIALLSLAMARPVSIALLTIAGDGDEHGPGLDPGRQYPSA